MICEVESWKIDDLKLLGDKTSSQYEQAIRRGMPHGHTRDVSKGAMKFKQPYRQVFRPGRIMMNLGLRERGVPEDGVPHNN